MCHHLIETDKYSNRYRLFINGDLKFAFFSLRTEVITMTKENAR